MGQVPKHMQHGSRKEVCGLHEDDSYRLIGGGLFERFRTCGLDGGSVLPGVGFDISEAQASPGG